MSRLVSSFSHPLIIYGLQKLRHYDTDHNQMAREKNKLFPYQEEGIKLITNHFKDVLLADHPGAGKTAQAVLACEELQVQRVLVICPASLRENWKREYQKWATRKVTIRCVYYPFEIAPVYNVYIVSYDLIRNHYTRFMEMDFDVMILDEAHYLKNSNSMRTKAVFEHLWPRAKKHIAITGTPLPNGRAIEGWSLFSKLVPSVFGSLKQYKANYCIKEVGYWGVNYNKSKNLKHLGELLRKYCMIRRDRSETIGQLPPAVRMVVPIKPDHTVEELELLLKFNSEENKDRMVASEAVKSARRAHGLIKIKPCLNYVENLLQESENCVIFAHHKDVLEGLDEGMKKAKIPYSKLTGEMTSITRQQSIDDFQNKKTKVFLGSMLAASTGITLTAASDVIILEADWVPSNNEQAEGRCHRITQDKITRFHYLVIPDSLDEAIAATILKKQKDILEVMRD